MTPDLQTSGNQDAESLAVLERFVVDNEDLLELESLIGKFNIFDALGIARAEIRHSNFLAFILDPAESHGQGQLFLKAILMDLMKEAPTNLRPLSPIELDGIDLRGVVVKREWKHTDLLITCKEPAFVIVVENKVGAHEHSDQLSRYKTTLQHDYPETQHLYVSLTPDAEDPSEEDWIVYSYTDIHRVLSRVQKMYRTAIGEEVRIFLDHYLALIGTRFMDNPEIDKLCQRIYKNHRVALDLIFERVGSPTTSVMAEVANLLQEDDRWEVAVRRNHILFLPKAWLH
jgi:PD-(D/E)XK nuclease superfamily